MQLTAPRRSEILQALLAKQMRPRNDIINPGQLAAELGAQVIRKKHIDKLNQEEVASDQELVDALQAGQATAPKSVVLEGVDGNREQIGIPGKREVKSEQAQAVGALPPDQQVRAHEILANRKSLSEPTLSEEIRLREQSNARLQQQNNAAALERQQLQTDAAAARQEKQIETQLSRDEQSRIQRDTEQIRSIQAQVSLERLKSENAIKEMQRAASEQGIDLTEQQAKATGWYTSAKAGEEVLAQYLTGENSYVPSINSISLYAKSIDPDTGAATRVQLRRAIPQQALNFLDAANMIVDPVVRMRTGAAVRSDEFITTFNSIVPIGDGSETERNNKNFFRKTMIDAMAAMSGGGASVGNDIVSSRGAPVQERGDLDEEVDTEVPEDIQLIMNKYK